MATIPRAVWIDRFVMHLSMLGVRANPEHITALAEELWPTAGEDDPVDCAQAAWDEWPPHDD